jgi:NAD(P)-dependent dehydrogenase (short-subunit alcohol dehydrogenase family)
MHPHFRHEVAVITGAGSGIGRALALQLAAGGARLALSYIDDGALNRTLRLQPSTTEARGYKVDVASREARSPTPMRSSATSARRSCSATTPAER